MEPLLPMDFWTPFAFPERLEPIFGQGMRTATFQSFRVRRTSSLNCLYCRSPYQTPHSLNFLPPFQLQTPFFTKKCFVASPSQKLVLMKDSQGKTPWVDQSCAECPGFPVLVFRSWVLLSCPTSRASSRSLSVCPWPSICLHGPSSSFLDLQITNRRSLVI